MTFVRRVGVGILVVAGSAACGKLVEDDPAAAPGGAAAIGSAAAGTVDTAPKTILDGSEQGLDLMEIWWLALDGDRAFFGGPARPHARAIYKVALTKGTPELIVERPWLGEIGVHEHQLVYVQHHDHNVGGTSHVLVHDEGSRTARSLDAPREGRLVQGFVAAPTGVYWHSWFLGTGESSVSRWRTGSEVAVTPDAYDPIVTDGSELFVLRSSDLPGQLEKLELVAYAIAGGKRRLIQLVPRQLAPTLTSDDVRVVAVDAGEIFYVRRRYTYGVSKPDAYGSATGVAIELYAVKKDGTSERLVMSDPAVTDTSFQAYDGKQFYWAALSSAREIVVTQGERVVERIWTRDPLTSLAVDSTRIAWATYPPAIHVRLKGYE